MKRGTSLLELLIYLCCTMLIGTLAGHLAFCYAQESRERTSRIDGWLQLALALDRLHEDLKRAPKDPSLWKKRTSHALIFMLGKNDCGWFLERGRVVRVTGVYNKTTQRWSDRATSVILDLAASLTFRCKHGFDGELSGVKATMTKKCGKRLLNLDCFTALREEIS